MNVNEKFVITVNRELGSGGRTVGRKLAEKLGVEYYDKALIKGLQEKYHLSVEAIEMCENYVNRYTKSSRYDTRNYDLVISANGKTEDEIVEFILQYMGK